MKHRTLSLILAATITVGTAAAADKPAKKSPGTKDEIQASMDHMREELGVNGFTAPSIESVLKQLRGLAPLPFDKVWRGVPAKTPQGRARVALSSGGIIADGFLVVVAEKQSRFDDVARAMLDHGKALGVEGRLKRHAKSIGELAMTKRWDDIRVELARSQAEAEAGLLDLKDEEIAHLISLGGWLRGMEISAAAIEEAYSAKHATLLLQPELLDYFISRLATLRPKLKADPLFVRIEADLTTLRKLQDRTPDEAFSEAEVKQIRSLAKSLNKAITESEE